MRIPSPPPMHAAGDSRAMAAPARPRSLRDAEGTSGPVLRVSQFVRQALCVPALLALLACGEQVPILANADTDDPGVQPMDPGAAYSPCGAPEACAPLPYCVFPSGEQGFCTEQCSSPDDPSNCVDDPGQLGRAFCLDIGLPSQDRVCAIDCGDGLPCPEGMRCEEVQTGAGPKKACF